MHRALDYPKGLPTSTWVAGLVVEGEAMERMETHV